MNDEKMSMIEVLDEFENWIENNWSAENMSPSQYRQALSDLDDLGMMSFDEIIDGFDTLYLDIDDFNFDIKDEEFEKKYSEIINDQIAYIEEFAQNSESDYGDDEW